jgi:formate hydrogenlyase subunit 3/multisubunit Na+/H+ antiporter MnhD subunit
MNEILLLPIAIPAVFGALVLLAPEKIRALRETVAVLGMALALASAAYLFPQKLSLSYAWLGFGLDFTLSLTRLSAFMLLGITGFGFLVSLYATAKPAGMPRLFSSSLLFTIALSSGVVLADNLVLLLFFWEGLLLTMFAMIAAGSARPFKAAMKALVIVGASDIAMIFGILLTGRLAGTFQISAIRLTADGIGGAAFVLLLIGAMGKSGAMPVHSWIPTAALDSPLPFMAIFPGSLDKILGIYFLTRISLDLFALKPGTWMSLLLMIIGAVTLLFAVLMALIQRDYKRLLSYHAISQVGYIVLGIGTAVPAGIVGGIFHMINNALYKNGLYLTAGAVERQAGTTDLKKLGGIGRRMPVTMLCFLVTAAAISGVPPLNGFFSKELIYDGALQQGWIFYAAALLGSFFTAASFLKLGHAAFFGREQQDHSKVKEAPVRMLIPMAIIAALCILFGLYRPLPLDTLIVPGVEASIHTEESFSGFPANTTLVLLSIIVLAAAILNHWYGARRTKSGAGALDHIHYAPGLGAIYGLAEKGYLDPYFLLSWPVKGIAIALSALDKAIDWLYETLSVKLGHLSSAGLRVLHNGVTRRYVLWSLAGAILVFVLSLALKGWTL